MGAPVNAMAHILISLLLVAFINPRIGAVDPLDQAWAAYIQEAKANATAGLQEGCVPRRFLPTAPRTGIVVLYHGYSACPQQYDDLGPLLAARGLEVLVPLIPGMGNNFNASGPIPSPLECPFQGCNGPVDDVRGMAIEAQDYIDFATRINDIVRVAPAPRAVLGVSVGGTLSAFSGQALDASGDALFARQLHINPEIKSAEADAAKSAVLEVMNKGPHSRRLWLGWGPGCRHERSLGRGGICTFRVENLVAAGHFGEATSDGLKVPRNTSVAVLYDNADPVISTAAVRVLTAKYRQQVPDTQSCVFNFTMHSFLSKWDDRGQSKWWINEVACDIVDYLVDGTPFKQLQATDPAEGAEHYCHLGCTEDKCGYRWDAPLKCPYSPPQ